MANWYEQDREVLLETFDVNANEGLKSGAISQKQLKYGKNQFEEQKGESIVKKILHHLKDVTTLILIVAAILSLAIGIHHNEGYLEFVVIMSIVVLNITLAVTQERSAEKSLAALKNLSSPMSVVLRDGKQQEIESSELVPGDIILLKTGNKIAADARLLEETDLAVDESILTGESEPVEKNACAELTGKMALGDQINMVFSGCLVTRGHAKAIVVETGMNTQMGHIAQYLNDTQKLKTPLQVRLDKIGKAITLVAIIAAVVMFAIGFHRGAELWEMIFVAVALAVAAVPETLSLIVTLILAHGVTEMVKKNALIRKLPAVETLGSTSVICTDKTGTLTQNLMTIKRLWQEGGEPFDDGVDFGGAQTELLNKFTLASNAVSDEEGKIIGDPTETAILRLFNKKGGNKNDLEEKYPKVAEIPFSSARKMMTTVHKDPKGGWIVLTKGAFDRVPFHRVPLEGELQKRQEIHDAFATDALRVIALGSKHIDKLPPEDKLSDLEKDLHFEGIIGIIDPPRPEVAEAIETARQAGIRTVMITGDHAVTARAIACQIGLFNEGSKVLTGVELSEMSDSELIDNVGKYSVYARVSPEDKIRIVEAWQEHDDVVAMTGDGVNDAPALKAADVGVAMGIAGTEVSKSAADMVLTDDNFRTIVDAVREGRNVFSNIRKTIYFLLVCNFSEIVIMLGAQLAHWALPLTPIMLLLINVIGDGIPGLQLAKEKSDPKIMNRHPISRNESLFEGLYFVIAVQTIAFSIVGLAAYYLGTYVAVSQTHSPTHAIGQTLCFLVVGWTSILHIFTVRSRQSVFKRTLRDNPPLVISVVAMIVLFASFVIIPPFAKIFGMTAIGVEHWLIAAALTIVPTVVAEIGKFTDNYSDRIQHKKRFVCHEQRAE